jgi:hypothetical protein
LQNIACSAANDGKPIVDLVRQTFRHVTECFDALFFQESRALHLFL